MSRYYERVADRAEHRCEYCRAPEIVFNMKFEVDHIVPRACGGSNSHDNLALSCPICNLFKSDYETGVDHEAPATEPLFHPREDRWEAHFSVNTETAEIMGVSAKGRATVNRLNMNRSHQLNARHRWMRLELFP